MHHYLQTNNVYDDDISVTGGIFLYKYSTFIFYTFCNFHYVIILCCCYYCCISGTAFIYLLYFNSTSEKPCEMSLYNDNKDHTDS